MEGVPLRQFVAENGPIKAARMLGLSYQALGRAAESARQIYVKLLPDGRVEGTEISDFPPKKRIAAKDRDK